MKSVDFIYEMKKVSEKIIILKRTKYLKKLLCSTYFILQNSQGRKWERKKVEDIYLRLNLDSLNLKFSLDKWKRMVDNWIFF